MKGFRQIPSITMALLANWLGSIWGRKTQASGVMLAPTQDDGMFPQSAVAIPQSGMARAEWFDRNLPRMPSDTFGVCTGGKASIGTMERKTAGPPRDSSYGSVMLVRQNPTEFPEPQFGISQDALTIWDTQVKVSRGLYDGDKEVYVNQDTQTIWG